MSQSDCCASRPATCESHPANHVLAHVNNGFSGWCLKNPDRFNFFSSPHGWPLRRHKKIFRMVHHLHLRPGAVTKCRTCPTRFLQSCIVDFAVINLRHPYGPSSHSPFVAGSKSFLPAVGVKDIDL